MSKPSAEVSATRHTKGPWKVGYVANRSGLDEYIVLGVLDCIATVHMPDLPSAEELEANARLIAASPMLSDLLRAMQNSEMRITPIRDWARTYEIDLGKASNSTVIAVAIRKALERAEGRSQ